MDRVRLILISIYGMFIISSCTKYENIHRIFLEIEDCVIREKDTSAFLSSAMHVQFYCSDIGPVDIFTALGFSYNIKIEYTEQGRYLQIAFCSYASDLIPGTRDILKSLPLHRLDISGFKVFEGCGTELWKLWNE